MQNSTPSLDTLIYITTGSAKKSRKKKFKIDWVPTADITPDSLTKALLCQKHKAFVKQLNLVDIKKRIKFE